MSSDREPDKIDRAIDAAEAPAAEQIPGPDPSASMVGQAQLLRLIGTPGQGWIRVIVPREFDDVDYVAVCEIALQLLGAAKQARLNPGGLELPSVPKGIVAPDGRTRIA